MQAKVGLADDALGEDAGESMVRGTERCKDVVYREVTLSRITILKTLIPGECCTVAGGDDAEGGADVGWRECELGVPSSKSPRFSWR